MNFHTCIINLPEYVLHIVYKPTSIKMVTTGKFDVTSNLSRQYLYLGNVFHKKTMMMMSCVPHLHLQATKLLPKLNCIL